MLFCIDGTGPASESDYNADMRRGFCYKLAQQNGSLDNYERGPTDAGLETWQIGDKVVDRIVEYRRKNSSDDIILAGHSRGAAACMYVSRKLKEHNIRVKGMVLFDAVRRALQSPTADLLGLIINPGGALVNVALDFYQVGQSIDVVSNVDQTLHLHRNEAYSNYFLNTKEYKDLISAEWKWKSSNPTIQGLYRNLHPAEGGRLNQLFEYHRRMRDACRFDCIKSGISTGLSFGNTGMKAEPDCRLELRGYDATHGAMGGAPLGVSSYISEVGYAEDISYREVTAMLDVQTQANSFLKQFKLNVSLDYVPASGIGLQNQTSKGWKPPG